jgi:ubiquinone/menaquinone biosynthesis C-methylase UbiE
MRNTIASLLLGLVPLLAQTPTPARRDLRSSENILAPKVSSPQVIVDRMLDLAEVKPGETVYDLGCGDGRILISAAKRFHAKGVGVEISANLVKQTNDTLRRENLENEISIQQGHLMDADLSSADVVTLYLETGSNEMIRPNLEKYLKPGARVVSHDFEIRGWKPVKVDKIHAYNRNHTIYLYQVPTSFKPKKN